ncbi:unnamed protein product [Rhizophagus irregularis]|nr:unnamed protein product [Rhizophagus irregularis]
MFTISRKLRETLFTQGNTRKLNDDDFKLYKDSSGCSSLRCEEDLISLSTIARAVLPLPPPTATSSNSTSSIIQVHTIQ